MMQQFGFGFEDGVPVLDAPAAAKRKMLRKNAGQPTPVAQAIRPLPVAANLLDLAPRANDASDANDANDGAHAVPPAPSLPAAAPADFEALARQLEAHADYRVLRRLVPRLQFDAPAQPADVARLLILDTETTGLSHARDKIMELALLRVDVDRATGQPVGAVQVYDGLEDPGQPIPAEVQAIMGKQLSEEEKLARAEHVVYNDDSQLILPQVLALDKAFRQMSNGK